MLQFGYLPSAGFKARSRELNKFKEKFAYPKVHRQANFETKRNNEIFESLLDIKAKKTKHYRKVYSGGQDNEEQRDSSDRAAGERVQDSQHLRSNMRKVDFQRDVMPYVYHMVHPQVRAMNTQLMSDHEIECL